MERGPCERRLQPDGGREAALRRQRRQIRVQLHELHSVGVRRGRNGEAPRLLLQHFRVVAERTLDQPVVRVPLAGGPGQAAEIEGSGIVGDGRSVGRADDLARAPIVQIAMAVSLVVVRPAAGALEQAVERAGIVVGQRLESVHPRRRVQHEELLECPGVEVVDGRIAALEPGVLGGAQPELRAERVEIVLRRRRERPVGGQGVAGEERVHRLVVGERGRRQQRREQEHAHHRSESISARSLGTPSTLCAPYPGKSRPPQRTTLLFGGSAARNISVSRSENGWGSSGSRTIRGARFTTSSSVTRGYRVSRVPAGRGTACPTSAARGYKRWRSANTFSPPPRRSASLMYVWPLTVISGSIQMGTNARSNPRSPSAASASRTAA